MHDHANVHEIEVRTNEFKLPMHIENPHEIITLDWVDLLLMFDLSNLNSLEVNIWKTISLKQTLLVKEIIMTFFRN